MSLRWDGHINRRMDTQTTYVVLLGKPLEKRRILDQKDQKILTQMLKQFIS